MKMQAQMAAQAFKLKKDIVSKNPSTSSNDNSESSDSDSDRPKVVNSKVTAKMIQMGS